MSGLRAILVSVDYDDLLSLTLPYNRHHFSEVMVVTGCRERDNKTADIAHSHGCLVYRTNSFWDKGALFNKWVALEQGLDAFGRHGWLCIMDADVLWPKDIVIEPWSEADGKPYALGIWTGPGQETLVKFGSLVTPRRHMYPTIPSTLPPEGEWARYPVHTVNEFAGYSQVFHASDPVLPKPPWHETNWKHAGGADSFFQMRWKERDKIRPPFNVLHLGPNGTNWCGRVAKYADGTTPENANVRVAELRKMIHGRRGKLPTKRYDHEKL